MMQLRGWRDGRGRIMQMTGVLLGLLLMLAAGEAGAQAYVREKLSIPGRLGTTLEGAMVRTEEGGRRPLVLLNHGSPRDAAARPEASPFGMYAQAVEFVRRGWTVAMMLRRGYGGSTGGWAEDYGRCDSPSYAEAGLRGAEDLRAALAFLAKRPDIDATKMIAVGVSAGGFATTALTAQPPPGLVAAINFAGGRGSQRDDQICSVHALTDAFGRYGKTSRTPMLWVYAVNDKYFNPQAVGQFREAFVSGGGKVSFVQTAAYGQDGHALFSAGGASIWTPVVDEFLKAQGLALRDAPAPLPPLPHVAPPKALSDTGRTAFEAYLRAAPHKAFAHTSSGNYAWRSGQRTADKAKEGALTACERAGKGSCTVSIDDGEAK